MRIATWNLKQAVAPKKPLDQLWRWAEDEIAADINPHDRDDVAIRCPRWSGTAAELLA